MRASIGLYFPKVSTKLNNTGLRYRAAKMSTIPYIRVVRVQFKSAVCGVKKVGQ